MATPADPSLFFKLVRVVNLTARPFQARVGQQHALTLNEWRVMAVLGGRAAMRYLDGDTLVLGGHGATIREVLGAKLYLRHTESWLEDRFLPFLADRAIPLPQTNISLEAQGKRYRVDCFWPAAGLVAELDGRDCHVRELAFEADRERDGNLLAAGYRVLRVTRRQLEEAPDLVQRRLRAALASRLVRPAP
jgi:very-short-patch-repair endonuclease